VGRQAMKRERFHLKQLVEDAIEMTQADTVNREISWAIEPLPLIEGDQTMMAIAVQNLIANAVKFTRQKVRAEIYIGHFSNEDGEDVFFVRDNGAGFSSQYTGKLFNLFQRLHAEAEFEGTGLGLANVRRIITRHGGRVWAEGSPGEGATFYFSLPGRETGSNNTMPHRKAVL
jgi:two-component system, chemotaxis family, sensor kinase Cph1